MYVGSPPLPSKPHARTKPLARSDITHLLHYVTGLNIGKVIR